MTTSKTILDLLQIIPYERFQATLNAQTEGLEFEIGESIDLTIQDDAGNLHDLTFTCLA